MHTKRFTDYSPNQWKYSLKLSKVKLSKNMTYYGHGWPCLIGGTFKLHEAVVQLFE